MQRGKPVEQRLPDDRGHVVPLGNNEHANAALDAVDDEVAANLDAREVAQRMEDDRRTITSVLSSLRSTSSAWLSPRKWHRELITINGAFPSFR